MIQKFIHQTISNVKKIPEEILVNIDFLKNNNPNWSYKLYEDEEVWAYLESQLPSNAVRELKQVNPKYGVVIADIFRYVLIFNEGGVYLDIKSSCRNKFDNFIKNEDVFLISQWENKLGEMYFGAGIYPELGQIHGGEFQQWYIIAEKKHPFLEAVVDRVLFNIKHYDKKIMGVGKIGVLRLSGPIIYTQTIFSMLGKYKYRIINSRKQGLVYSIYEEIGKKNFHTLSGDHYSKQKEPIIV